MSFASIVNEEFGVKVSFENETRRASFACTTYAALLELVAKLFEIDPASAVLKYQDEDDKVTMSTDGEFQDAILLAKAEKKTLRLFVELRTAEVKAEVRSGEQFNAFSGARSPYWKHGPFPGPFHHGRGFRGHHGHHGHHGLHGHHSPHFGSVSEDSNPKQSVPPTGPASEGHGLPPFVHPHPRSGHEDHPRSGHEDHPRSGHKGHPCSGHEGHPCSGHKGHPRFGHEGHHRFGHEGHGHPHPRFGVGHTPFHGSFSPADVFHLFGVPTLFAHGTFSPADSTPAATTPFERESQSPYTARCAFKERKQAMKETIGAMKSNASTPEDAQAIREFKEKMRAERKGRCHFGQQNWDRLVAKHVSDVTIPDNSELPADTPVTKTWKLKNAGTTAWPADSQLVFVSRHGDNLNGPERVDVEGPIQPQQEVEVSVTFITPGEPGRYIGYYRMATSDGAKFGQKVWVSFVIPKPNPAPKEAGTAADVTMD